VTAPVAPDPGLSPENGLLRNGWLVAKREFAEKVGSRIFAVSTLLLAGLAVVVALTPVLIKAVDRGTTTTIAITSPNPELTRSSIGILEGFLNPAGAEVAPYTFVEVDPTEDLAGAVSDGRYAGAMIGTRLANGGLSFQFLAGETVGTDRVQQLQVGSFAIGIFDWISRSGSLGAATWQVPVFNSASVATGGGAPETIGASEYAGRRIVGVVFVVLIFITLVIYGMWVATGVAAEKSSRVMELMISAASPVQLLVGKVVGLGLAGLTQYVAILVPAIVILLIQDRLAVLALGPSGSGEPLVGLTLPLLGAFMLFFVLGFALYALIYAAAGSLVSRPEDLQVVALPLSLISMVGYLIAIAALGGASGTLVTIGSYVPFWSPFVMLGRLMVGRVEPWELALSVALLVLGIAGALWLAIRVYSAGVLLYGQRPGLRTFVAAARRPG